MPGGSPGPIVILTGGRETTIEKALLAVAEALSVTRMVKLKVPELIGVPPIAPVEALSDRPGGSEPAVIAQL